MKPECEIKKRIAERNGIEEDKEKGKSQETQQFISAKEESSWQEAVDIIAATGSIKLIAV